MGFGDVAWVDGLPKCVVGRWGESLYAPGRARLVRAVDEMKVVSLRIESKVEGS